MSDITWFISPGPCHMNQLINYRHIYMKWLISVEEDGDGSHWIRLQSRRSSTNDREQMRRSQTEQFELADMIVYKL